MQSNLTAPTGSVSVGTPIVDLKSCVLELTWPDADRIVENHHECCQVSFSQPDSTHWICQRWNPYR